MPLTPLVSNRQRFDESYTRSHQALIGALQAIKAAKDDEDQKKRQALQDKVTQQSLDQGAQSIAQNQMVLDKQKQDSGLVSQFNDQIDREANPAALGPTLPGQPSAWDTSPLTDKGRQAQADQFKYSIIAKRRTLAGKESTPQQVQAEYEAENAKNADAVDAASTGPALRKMDMRVKGAQANNLDAEAAKNLAEAGAKGKPKPMDANEIVGNETALLGKFLGQAQPFIQVRDAYSRIKSAAKKPSAAADLSLIFNYMKMLDPGSTVREGEFANAQNAGGAWDKVGAMYNKIASGERLTEPQRADFLDQSNGLYAVQKANHTKLRKSFQDIATRSTLNPDNVAPDLSLDEEPAKIGRFEVEVAP